MTTTDVYPVELAISESGSLNIVWNDGLEQQLAIKTVRKNCSCASCLEKEKASALDAVNRDPSSLPIVSAAETTALEIVRMRPVGNYAYHIEFNDGHTSGVYTFESLRALS